MITGDTSESGELLLAALTSPDPSVCVLRAEEDADLPAAHPAKGKALTGQVAAYICRAAACGLPMHEPDALAAALRQHGTNDEAIS